MHARVSEASERSETSGIFIFQEVYDSHKYVLYQPGIEISVASIAAGNDNLSLLWPLPI